MIFRVCNNNIKYDRCICQLHRYEHENIILKRNINYSNLVTNDYDFDSRQAFESSLFCFSR